MENATNALLMGAVILISVVILSIAVYLFTYFADYARGVEGDVKANQISQFNSQFLSYQGKELTIYDVITLANMAKDYNQKNGYVANEDNKPLGYITIQATPFNGVISEIGSNNIKDITNEELIGKPTTVQEGTDDEHIEYVLTKYNASVTVNNDSKLVEKVTITIKP